MGGSGSGMDNWSNIPASFRWIVIAALFSGAGSGLGALSQDTSDRYHASEAHQDFAIRDKRIDAVEIRDQANEVAIKALLQSSAEHGEAIRSLRDWMRNLESQYERHVDRHHTHDK